MIWFGMILPISPMALVHLALLLTRWSIFLKRLFRFRAAKPPRKGCLLSTGYSFLCKGHAKNQGRADDPGFCGTLHRRIPILIAVNIVIYHRLVQVASESAS